MRLPTGWLQRLGWRLLILRAVPQDEQDLARGAVVFAPHPDDETLGCGGTIAGKTDRGAVVHVVFLTDGAASHAGQIAAAALREIREAEALAALRRLGVDGRRVDFLRLADGRLAQHEAEATQRVAALLRSHRPGEIYIPYRGDAAADHAATRRIVLAAAARVGFCGWVLEYPVWFWCRWPGLAGWHCLRELRLCTRLGPLRARKRAALDEYRSQMTRLREGPWPVLGDVAGGRFLACLLREWELFCRYRVGDR